MKSQRSPTSGLLLLVHGCPVFLVTDTEPSLALDEQSLPR